MPEEKGFEGNGNGDELVLIAGRPCRMRDSLHILLKTMPGIDIVGYADDGSSTQAMSKPSGGRRSRNSLKAWIISDGVGKKSGWSYSALVITATCGRKPRNM